MQFKMATVLVLSLFSSCLFATTNTTTPNDAQAVNWLIIVDKNEIMVAKETLQKTTDPQVKKFAKAMLTDHGKNLKQTMTFSKQMKSTPTDGEKLNQMKKDGNEELSKLSKLNKNEYDLAYAKAMVQGHTDALNQIDEMLKTVDNSKLKTHLENTRSTIHHHLQEAQALQQQMESKHTS